MQQDQKQIIQEQFVQEKQEKASCQIEYKEYPERYTTLIGYLLVIASYFFSIGTFNVISANTSDIYDVKPIVVSLNSLMQNILFLPLTFPVGYILEKFGLCVSIYVASALITIAVWLRILININYYIVLIAHILMGIGLPFVQIMITKLSLIWFRTEKRQSVTQILMVFTLITVLISSLLPGIWMKDYDSKLDEQNGYKEGRSKVYNLMMIQAIISSALAIIGCLLFKEKPKTPPSFTASLQREDASSSIKKLIKSKNYIIIFTCYGLFSGNLYTFGVTMSYLFKPYGFESDVVSFSGVSMVIFGAIGAGIGGKLFKKKPQFKLFIIIGIIGSITGLALTLVLLPVENSILIMIPYMIIGLVSMQVFPIFLELASETAYPVSESVSSGLLLGGSNLVGFTLGTIFSAMLDDDSKTMVMIVQISSISIYGICLLLVKFLKVELNRSKVDAMQEGGIKIIDEIIEEEKSTDSIQSF